MEGEEEIPSLSSSQILQLAETHLRLRNFSLCRQYLLEAHLPDNHRYAASLLAVADILSAASAGGGANPNWYSVLQVDTFCSDLNLIRTQYKNLLHLLSPIKEKFPLAGEAVNWVSKGYNVLSNPSKKAEFDAELGLEVGKLRSCGESSVGNETFWTFCPYCYCMYEYSRVYVGCCLRCPNGSCRRVFQGIVVSNLPPIGWGENVHFGCYGYYPLGFSPSEFDEFGSWSPFVDLFPAGEAGVNVDSGLQGQGSGSDEKEMNVGMSNDSGESESSENANVREFGVSSAGANDAKLGTVRRKTIDMNASNLTGKGRESRLNMNENVGGIGGLDLFGDSEIEDDEFGSGFGSGQNVAGASGCGVDPGDVEFFEKDGEIFVGLGPDDAI